MAGFNPSASAAAAALAGKNVITQRMHPGGAQGVKFSLAEVAARVRDGRNDPRLKGWAGQELIKAGKPKGVRAQMQALLDAFRARTMYIPDPVQTEMVAKAVTTLCLDEHGLCMPASDCDDRVVALGGAALSLGIDVKVIGQAFNGEPVESHVIFAVRDPDENRWIKIDPSHDTWNVGQAAFATKETEVDPLASMNTGFAGSSGDFIGIGQLPTQATYVLGQNTVPLNAPVGSVVQEQPGSEFVTSCTKQANGTWTCTNGSVFQPGQLEHLASVTCPAGQTFVSPGLCVPPGGLKLASGATLMPDGSYHMPDGGVLLADGSYTNPDGTTVAPGGQVTLSASAQITNALAAAAQTVTHPLDAAALGAQAIGQGAANVAGGLARGVTSPSVGGEALAWIGAIAAAAAGVYVLAPIVKELVDERAAKIRARRA